MMGRCHRAQAASWSKEMWRRRLDGDANQHGPAASSIPHDRFFSEFHGHKISDLEHLYAALKNQVAPTQPHRFIWLAGDSSLDNKAWLNETVPAANGYEHVLSPPLCRPDVAFHLNSIIAHEADPTPTSPTRTICINTAVEESTLAARNGSYIFPHDTFIRDNVGPNDVLVVSVGGNDIALNPSAATMANASLLIGSESPEDIDMALGHFVGMFRDDTRHYVMKLIEKARPALVLVCMIYFPDQRRTPSWANSALAALDYDTHPEKLQAAIRQVYELGTRAVRIEGTKVVPLALFDVLDGTDSSLYVDRVEPSSKGGEMMARTIWEAAKANA
ncbi:unnamed protein product [Vitrella brassicaformis CCMP3155]|uniref:SGNH hydrolase-type esterase domain-containing protein n=2 Tax=Vitrella brassicaformis TaxID=1169539 RepID=A0A0G4GTX4_VITBC|nr:unnamed protein product [Vitrella brassicaformis CCMP3155]|eukprot:CEM34068.1 unnamed protein product [Vitrella brassicaformis CCMP3155]